MFYMFDRYYMMLVVPALIFSMWAQARVSGTFNRYSKMGTMSGMTGYDSARRILDANGLRHVTIERVAGNLTDHFDPKGNVIRLSDGVYGSNSVAAIGVAAHEAGHAVQYAQSYAPIKLRAAIIPITQLGSTLSMPLVLVGLFMGAQPLVNLGILLFSMMTVFQLVTLPVEFNASSRAVMALEMGGSIAEDEIYGVKKVLGAAALTYVAALAVSLANLLRLFMLFGRRDD
ncbi:MAG: zinc metallopeptidase [Oscillospiraceae bacterium]